MVSSSVNIQRDLPAVWAKIEEEFCKTFKCKAKELKGRKTSASTKNYSGTSIKVFQTVTEHIPQESITIQSINGNDVVTSTYTVKAFDDSTTIVTLSVSGSNTHSALRSLNYSLMSLPVFRSGTRKRLATQLSRLKKVIESEGAQ